MHPEEGSKEEGHENISKMEVFSSPYALYTSCCNKTEFNFHFMCRGSI
jgi:hypothetical protein